MRRSLLVSLVCASLSACTDTYEDRLQELDAHVMVDCGEVSDCDSQTDAEAAVTCLRDNLAAGVPARALFILGIDPVAYVYALDGGYVSIDGYCPLDEPCEFTEYACREVTASGGGLCWSALATECDKVRDW